MIINGKDLLQAAPILMMSPVKNTANGTSWGLSEAGYDIRIQQDVHFVPEEYVKVMTQKEGYKEGNLFGGIGRFTLASAMEQFMMPPDLVGIVHDKSTWARRGLSVFNTVIEPGFQGGLTLELVYHGNDPLSIPAGSGIAQVIFTKIKNPAQYNGKYQGQSSEPEPARDS